MPSGLPHLHLRTALAVAFAIAASLPALPALAQGHRAACVTHGHAAHAHCTAHGQKARHTHSAKRHQAAHRVLVTRPAVPGVPRSVVESGATCEDGSAPISGPRGTTACADGSQATCADGSQPAKGDCPASSETETGGEEPGCEDVAGTCDLVGEDTSPCREASASSPEGEGPGFICEG